MRIFPLQMDTPVADAAARGGIWGSGVREGVVDSSEVGTSSFPSRHPFAEASRSGSDGVTGQTSSDGVNPVMPFDMDIPVAYSSIAGGAVSDVKMRVLAGGLGGVPNAVVPIDDLNEQQTRQDEEANRRRDAAIAMERIETDRIPCPRLCGAVFSPGVGGLALFNNGGVRKMWKWWEKTDPSRLAPVPGLVVESSSVDREEIVSESNASGEESTSLLTTAPAAAVSRNCPRTLQDVLDMTSAAKEAQWGEEQEDSDASSVDFRDFGAGLFFDEGSDEASSDSGDEEMEGVGGLVGDSSVDEAEETHHRHRRTPSGEFLNLHRRTPSESMTLPGRENDDPAGPSSDMLAPFVSVTHQFDQLSLNDQTVELAVGWSLGRLVIEDTENWFDGMSPEPDRMPNSSSHNALNAGPSSQRITKGTTIGRYCSAVCHCFSSSSFM